MIGSACTFAPGPEWFYYTDTLPLGTAPSLDLVKHNLEVSQAVNRGSTF